MGFEPGIPFLKGLAKQRTQRSQEERSLRSIQDLKKSTSLLQLLQRSTMDLCYHILYDHFIRKRLLICQLLKTHDLVKRSLTKGKRRSFIHDILDKRSIVNISEDIMSGPAGFC
uniref:Uncharacterized protein n=1 Tax=Cacopsylla melanoneura TaxID=428564 RepID=A0A8D8QX31_9HEMI